MPPQKRATRRSTKAAKPPKKPASRRRTKTQALAVADAVRREPVKRVRVPNPLAAFEPLRRSVVDRQLQLIDLAVTWSPAHVIVDQHAAFWSGFANEGAKGGTRRRPARKAARGKASRS